MFGRLKRYSDAFAGWGLLALRFVVGAVFIMHGGAIAGFLGQVGIQPAAFWAVVVTAAELAGGIALVLGVLTRLAALALTVTMVVAITSVLAAKGFFLPGYEFAFTLLGASVALMLTGPGRYAIDTRIGVES